MSAPHTPSASNAAQVTAPVKVEASSGTRRTATTFVAEATWRALNVPGRDECMIGVTVTSNGGDACILSAWRAALPPDDAAPTRETVAAEWAARARSVQVLRNGDAFHIDVFDAAGTALLRLSRINGRTRPSICWAQGTLAAALGLHGGQYEVVDVNVCGDGSAA